MKKFILLLFALFSLSFLSGYANAVCPSGMEGGDTASNPCLITNCSQLQNMSQDLSGNFALVNDIDCSETASWNSGLGFLPVGNSGSNFYGTFDGRGYSISNLYINRTSSSNIGLFGYVSSNKLICNVHLVDVNITGFYDVGGLVGYANTVKIDNCSVSGKIRGTITGDADGYIGGLIGVVYDAGYIINSYADVSVSTEGRFVGCLAGQTWGTPVRNLYSKGTVSGSSYVGGLIGYFGDMTIILNNSFSTANATASSGTVGGLIGGVAYTPSIFYSYSTGNVSGPNSAGGLVGSGSIGMNCANSFWDNETSGKSTSSRCGAGKTTAQMKNISTFTSLTSPNLTIAWDFINNPYNDTEDKNYWDINPLVNDGYPYLAGIGIGLMAAPVISVTYPQNLTSYLDITELNYTVSDSDGVDSCWYSLNNGQTNSSLFSAGENFSSLSAEDGWNTWAIYCNDTIGNIGSSSVNFNKDILDPYFTSIENQTSEFGSLFAAQINASDDGSLSPYSMENIPANSSLLFSYTKEFSRNSSGYNAYLPTASISAADSYSGEAISAESPEIILAIPSSDAAQQLTIVKNVYYISENSTSVNYTINIEVVNSGGEDLSGISLTDSDLNIADIISLNRTQNATYSSSVIVTKAASNTNKLFSKASASVNSVIYQSNQIQIRIPGYGGPADAVVDAPASVSASSSFSSTITILNQNQNIGQDFVVDYWIANEAENTNYSSGEQTIYVAASGSSALTATLTSPSASGNYKLRAIVSWAGGTATGYDSFTVSSSTQSGTSSGSSGGSSGGGITCNRPYALIGGRCCLDSNGNGICDNQETETGEVPSNRSGIRESLAYKDKIIIRLPGMNASINNTFEILVLEKSNATIKAYYSKSIAASQKKDGIIFALNTGEEKRLDLNADSTDDILLRLEKIEDNETTIYLEPLIGGIQVEEIEKYVFKSNASAKSIAETYYFASLLILAFCILMIIISLAGSLGGLHPFAFLGRMISGAAGILKKREKNKPVLSSMIGLKVYSSDGNFIGRIKDIYVGDSKIEAWIVSLSPQLSKKFRRKNARLEQKYIKSVSDVIILDQQSSEFLES